MGIGCLWTNSCLTKLLKAQSMLTLASILLYYRPWSYQLTIGKNVTKRSIVISRTSVIRILGELEGIL